MKKIIIPFLLIILLYACKKNAAPIPEPKVIIPKIPYNSDKSFKIVAYFPSYRNPDSVDVSKYKMITHLYYAFLNPDANGNLKALAEPARFQKVISRSKSNGVKVGISVSGTDATFVALAASGASRTRLVKNIIAFVRQYDLDGVDMDWEYPRTTSGSDLTFSLLMKELSDTLHNNNKYLSAAVTPGVYAGAVREGIRSETYTYTDFFNIMMYDGLGWDKAEPLQHSSYRMSESSLDTWLVLKGLPKEKAVVGFPSYGRNSANAATGYRDLIHAGANPDLDSATYKGATFYYNGTATIKRKAILAKDRANGMMLWELYFDTNGKTSLLKAVNDTLKRVY